MNSRRILVVEDDESIGEFLLVTLRSKGFEMSWAQDGPSAVRLFEEELPDLVLLDLNLPGIDGTELLKWIRESSQVPVLIVSCRNDEIDKVCTLELGADDYITKPFSARELVARVRTNLRREAKSSEVVVLGDLTVDWKRAEVSRSGIRVILSRQEFEFLRYLYQNRDRVLSRELLVERVWGYDFEGDTRVVDTAVKRLRRKIGAKLIETVRGQGYRMLARD